MVSLQTSVNYRNPKGLLLIPVIVDADDGAADDIGTLNKMTQGDERPAVNLPVLINVTGAALHGQNRTDNRRLHAVNLAARGKITLNTRLQRIDGDPTQSQQRY